jgi:hypothetical protein
MRKNIETRIEYNKSQPNENKRDSDVKKVNSSKKDKIIKKVKKDLEKNLK